MGSLRCIRSEGLFAEARSTLGLASYVRIAYERVPLCRARVRTRKRRETAMCGLSPCSSIVRLYYYVIGTVVLKRSRPFSPVAVAL